jgi:hypothetical protein
MRKSIYVVMMLMLVLMISSNGNCANKYDKIKQDQGWENMNKLWVKHIGNNPIMKNYLDLLVSEKEIQNLSKSGKFTSEQKSFMSANSKGLYRYIQIAAAQEVSRSNKNQPVTDDNLIYITGVIKDPKAQAAKNGVEYQMEQEFFRANWLYLFHENWKKENMTSKAMSMLFQAVDKMK